MKQEKTKEEIDNNPDNIKAMLYLDNLEYLLKRCEQNEIYEECQRLSALIKITKENLYEITENK